MKFVYTLFVCAALLSNKAICQQESPDSNYITQSPFFLAQNYPNPVSKKERNLTVIPYSIYSPAFFKLSVYNMVGKLEYEIFRELKTPGTYEAIYDTSKLNAGIYLYTLETNDLKLTKKFIVID